MKDSLITDNLKLIDYTISKMNLRYNLEDCYGAGLIGLVMAGKTYKADKGCKFTTYAICCIKYEIMKYLKSEKTYKRKTNINNISLDEPLYIDSIGNELNLYDTLESDINIEKECEEKHKRELLYKIISILDDKDRIIMNHYYGLNGYETLNKQELKKKLNISAETVTRHIDKSIKIIRKIMKSKGVVE